MEVRESFLGGKMNKDVDERIVPDGQYIDALNARVEVDDSGEGGVLKNALGNTQLTNLQEGTFALSQNAFTICTFEAPEIGKIFWFVADSNYDVIVSYDIDSSLIQYHVISSTVLNFSSASRIRANLIDDLLFFTDDLNPPRYININRAYPTPIAGVDQFDEDDIAVILGAPLESPDVTPIAAGQGQNYMEDKFVSFAVRWQGLDGQFTAVSPFSLPSFIPGQFKIDFETFDQIGMLNINSKALVDFNTGSDLITHVEVLFKESDSQVIKVIERFSKEDEGWGNNETRQITFDNRKIYSALPESETLRIYDNVPLLSKAQTTDQNRLYYSNYVEGYDMPPLDFSVEIVSESVGSGTTPSTQEDYDYTTYESRTILGAGIEFDLDGVDLKQGTLIFLDMSFTHSQFGGSGTYPGDTNSFTNTVGIQLVQDYASVNALYNSEEFRRAIGGAFALPIGQCADGGSLDDLFNCSILPSSGWTYESTSQFITNNIGTRIQIFPPVIRLEDNSNPGTFAYEYFEDLGSQVSFRENGNNSSLHSDRGYEVALVYMDGYGRRSEPQTVASNTVNTTKAQSANKNVIRATINSEAPDWADRYHFVLKPDRGRYETVIATTYFRDPRSGTWFIKLVGDNISKVKVGERLIVKQDSSGISLGQNKVKVLSLDTKEENFIDPSNPNTLQEPSGVYMEVEGNFVVSEDEDSFISYGLIAMATDLATQDPGSVVRQNIAIDNIEDTVVDWFGAPFSNEGPRLAYPTYLNDGTAAARSYTPYEIPVGSTVKIFFEHKRAGGDSFRFLFDNEFIATRNYPNLYDFIIGESIDFSIPTNDTVAEANTTPPEVEFDTSIETTSVFPTTPPTVSPGTGLKIQYCRKAGAGTGGEDVEFLSFRSGARFFDGRHTRLDVRIEIDRTGDTLIFETEPEETDGVTFYDASETYAITNNYHEGNIQNQGPSDPAIVDLEFYDCFSFGNGVESYKVRDALDGRELTIGVRPYIITEEGYRQVRRENDITFSNVYQRDSNFNKLNEFNRALINWKELDRRQGPVQVIDSVQDNIFVLKENGISWVIATGKEFFADAQGGGAILNVDSVLGREIVRPEQYGISQDPDTYVRYGNSMFWADAFRNVMLSLVGGVNGQLQIISAGGMKSWFRELFIDLKNRFKIGGYDPFHDQYVFASIPRIKGAVPISIESGSPIVVEDSNEQIEINIDLGSNIGTSEVVYNVLSGTANIEVVYNGSTVISQTVSGSGTLPFAKDQKDITEAVMTITPTDSTYEVVVTPPDANNLKVVLVVTNSVADAGKTTTINYSSGNAVFSPSSNITVVFEADQVAMFKTYSGTEGNGDIPAEGNTVRVDSIKQVDDNYEFELGIDRFMYLITDTVYNESDVISTLIPAATEITPVNNPLAGEYYAEFTYNNPSDFKYLYVIWDLSPNVGFDSDTISMDSEEITFDNG